MPLANSLTHDRVEYKTFVSHFPRALPWAVTWCAFGTEHLASRPDCASLLWIVITILPEQNPDKSMTLMNPTFAHASPALRISKLACRGDLSASVVKGILT